MRVQMHKAVGYIELGCKVVLDGQPVGSLRLLPGIVLLSSPVREQAVLRVLDEDTCGAGHLGSVPVGSEDSRLGALEPANAILVFPEAASLGVLLDKLHLVLSKEKWPPRHTEGEATSLLDHLGKINGIA